MSESRDYITLLIKGKADEEKYAWVSAIEPYEKALILALRQSDFLKAAEICERIGFCYHRAAMQVENQQDFRKHMLKALGAYGRAAKLFEKSEDPKKPARICQCKATAAYVNSWLDPDFASRKRLLDECRKLEKEALRFYEGIADRLGSAKTCNELNACLIDRLNLEWNKQRRQEMLAEALSYGHKAILTLSELGEKYELTRAYYMTSIHCHTAAEGLELEEKGKRIREALSYSRKAARLSEKIGDSFLIGMSNIWAGSAIVDFTDHADSATRYFEEALECGKRTRDNYLIGRASYLLAYLTAWNMVTEEEPKKIMEESKKCEIYSLDAIRSFASISNDQEAASGYYWQAENFSFLAKSVETSLKGKCALLKKSIEAGNKGLEHARRSGSISAMWFILHPLSKSLFLLSTMETDADESKRLLEKSLRYREENIKAFEQAMPYYFWNHGVYYNYLALIQAELAKSARNKKQKVKLLEDAVESAGNCIKLCLKSGTLSQGQYATLGGYYSDFGGILGQLYMTTGSSELLRELLEVQEGAVETSKKADLPSRVAEAYWQQAKIHDQLGNLAESAESFELAHDLYIVAAKKIPSLRDFYLNHAYYMKGWREIQKARHCHARLEYDYAKRHYEGAANFHKSAKAWKYLVPNYLAWAQLESGEDLSRREQPKRALGVFQQAAELFAEAKKSIETRLETTAQREERQMATELVSASDIRRKYCLARVSLEGARILDKKGEYMASSRKYLSAAEGFQSAIKAMKLESDREEFRPIVSLCKAWQMMMRAEAEASPKLYLKASQLFDEAKEDSLDEKTRLLALGHSCFCKALEAGRRFEATRDATLHSTATRYLEVAADYYFRAGFKRASEYAKATQRFFDAHIYMHKAKTVTDPLEKTQYYRMSEKLLRASASSYVKAKKPEKGEDIRRLLESVSEERELALSLAKVVHAPAIVSTTTSFLTPTATHEQAVGLERFENANIQASLTSNVKEIKAGEDFSLEIQIANVGKAAVLLAGVEEILPKGFDLVGKPSYCELQDTRLDMKGKRLDPLKIEKAQLILRPFGKGALEINPRIIYIDETGNQMSSEPKPLTIDVLEVVLPGRITTGYEDLDNLLLGGIPEHYSVILSSPSCDEKDLLIKRFLESGIKNGQVTFLLTTGMGYIYTQWEESPSKFFIFICNPRADTMAGSLPNVFRLKGVENLTEITIALTQAFRTLDTLSSGPRRACIGIISDVLLQHHVVQTRRWLADIIPELRSRGFTTLGVMNPEMHQHEEVQAILELFDGEINIGEKETKKGLEKFLKIKKMHNQRYSESELSHPARE